MQSNVMAFAALMVSAYVMGYGTRAYIGWRNRRRYRFSLSRA
jgi:hypothetical protein